MNMFLYRPVGPEELKLIKAQGMTKFPPRLPHQPIFYPVMTQEYAAKIAKHWNVADSGAGFVLKFSVPLAVLDKWPVQLAGGQECKELWVPAEELDEFNKMIIGEIVIVNEFYA